MKVISSMLVTTRSNTSRQWGGVRVCEIESKVIYFYNITFGANRQTDRQEVQSSMPTT